ncbi:hypothetical protein GLW00_02970 [Halobacillus litoralis]|uniref:Uncharacterized protein n=1 Tax=Halobacillus litoralis TaxID=45668 RepID=A0A845F7M2_9BACI|nr:hypothetical protein [Halobacillus litoralis]MYL69794.1 hypothetical protein [Halobacillus litoralis]
MRNKIMFTREAARRNIYSIPLPPLHAQSDEWLNLNAVVSHYSQLRLKPGWNLLRKEGHIYVENQEKEIAGAEWTDGIIGDDSPLFYLQAAVCDHHLNEYSIHKTSVIEEAIIDDAYVRGLDLLGQWDFGDIKRSLNPIFFYDSLDHPAVIFFTFHREGKRFLQKHIHRFSKRSYRLKVLHKTWMTNE